MIIKNKLELGTSKLRRIALELVECGIERVLPKNLIHSSIKFNKANKILNIHGQNYDLNKMRLFVVGGGKAVGQMAEEIEKIVGAENITAGVVNCKSSAYKTKKIQVIGAGHPIPNKKSVSGVEEILKLKEEYNINENDLVLCLISGGGSSLMTYAVEKIRLKDKQRMTELLIYSGAQIQEQNIVRKHLSEIKGGQLGRFFSPTTVVSLIISDVVTNDVESIASGPTVADSSTYQDALNVLEKYNLIDKAPKGIVEFLKNSIKNNREDTPEVLENCRNYIIGDNILALGAIADRAHHLGLKPLVVTAEQVGDPEAVAKIRVREIFNGDYTEYDTIIVGGETTPKLPEKAGKGGRNQHFAAVTINEMVQYSGEYVLVAISTDGVDYIEGIAGVIIDEKTIDDIKNQNIDIREYINDFNSYKLFKKISNSFIKTGDTGTNVSDIMVYILK